MHGLVTGEDPRQRRGDLQLKLENPLGFFESERLVETNDALLKALGCRWDRPPLFPASWDHPPSETIQPHRSRFSIYALERSRSIKIRGCALRIPPICTFFCVVSRL